MNTVERVKELAAERDISLFGLSKLCDVPYSTIKNTELRCGQLGVDTIAKYLDNIHLHPEEEKYRKIKLQNKISVKVKLYYRIVYSAVSDL